MPDQEERPPVAQRWGLLLLLLVLVAVVVLGVDHVMVWLLGR